MTIGIVGLGLIGGSMAKSIKQRTQHKVLGIDLNPQAVSMALMSGAIDEKLTDERLCECDIVMPAINPSATIAWGDEKAGLLSKSCIVIDLCGVKRGICSHFKSLAAQYGFSYVGGHPMAGKECSGFTNADAELFSGASMILTPDETAEPTTLEMLKQLFLDIGFKDITFSTPSEHDRIIAYTSQLAHITSSAYVKSPFAQKRMGFSAGSFNDMTRVARLDEELWTELFIEDRDFLTDELEILIGNLTDYLKALKSGDSALLKELLKDGRLKKESTGGR